MTQRQYRAAAQWFAAHPAAKALLRVVSKGSVALVYAAYLGLLGWLGWHRDSRFWPVLLVPAAAFVLGSALRRLIDRPRPYETLDFAPVFPKATKGQSFPSRHCFSAAAIAVTAGWALPPLGGLLAAAALVIALCRVMVGHHYISDVLAGLAFGAGVGWLGLWLAQRWLFAPTATAFFGFVIMR